MDSDSENRNRHSLRVAMRIDVNLIGLLARVSSGTKLPSQRLWRQWRLLLRSSTLTVAWAAPDLHRLPLFHQVVTFIRCGREGRQVLRNLQGKREEAIAFSMEGSGRRASRMPALQIRAGAKFGGARLLNSCGHGTQRAAPLHEMGERYGCGVDCGGDFW